MKLFVWIIILYVFQDFVTKAQTELPENRDSVPKSDIYDTNTSSRWIRELKNIIIVSPKSESVADSFNIESPSSIYVETEGQTIETIRIVRLKPFGTSITDSAYNKINWLGRTGNAIHVNTRNFVIRNALMFKEGDIVDGFKLAYTERYLRSLKYVGDARVTAIPISDDKVEVLVVVQDILPYSVELDTDFAAYANTTIVNDNIVGLGIELHASTFVDTQKDNLMGYNAKLRSSSIGRSFISFQANYLDRYEDQLLSFELRRDFYTPTTKYAGHIILNKVQIPARYFDPNDTNYLKITPITIKYNHFDVWLGRSFRLTDKHTFNKQIQNITVSFRAQHIKFIDRPEKSQERYYRFQNRTTCLASLSWTQQAFYKTSLIYNFGRTEDISYGNSFSIVAGEEFNEMYVRPYIGANYSTGYFIPKFGYLSGAIAYGTFFKQKADQGVISIEMNYFTNLYVLRNYRLRTFLNGSYTGQLYNRLEDKLIIDGENGIPGFRNDSVFGRHRFNFSIEQNIFMPRDIYSFRFVVYAFTYLSWLGNYNESVMLSNLYSSFGIGLRIRNNRLIFNTVQFRFAYFPDIPKNSRFKYYQISRESVLRPRDFMPKAPDIMPLY